MLIEFAWTDIQQLERIRTWIQQWEQQYQIAFTQKTVKGIHRLCFDEEQHYTIFCMTWRHSSAPYTVVVDRNPRTQKH